MAQLIPPSPVGVPMGSSTWNQWLETVRQIINSGAAGVLWANINFAGSNITDLASRAHNNLQSMQGGAAGEYYHLTAAEYSRIPTSDQQGRFLSAGQYERVTSVIQLATDPTTTEIGTNQWAIYKNTTSGNVKLWANDGGTMKSVLLT